MLTESSTVFRRLVHYVKPYSFWVGNSRCFAGARCHRNHTGQVFRTDSEWGAASATMIVFLLLGMLVIGMPCRYLIKYASARFSVKVLRDLRNELVRRFAICRFLKRNAN